MHFDSKAYDELFPRENEIKSTKLEEESMVEEVATEEKGDDQVGGDE